LNHFTVPVAIKDLQGANQRRASEPAPFERASQ
jgi:hypothetical protein